MKWSFVPVIIIIAFLFIINPKADKQLSHGKKLSKWNGEVEKVEGKKDSSRSIASLSKVDPSRKTGRVIPYKNFKKQVNKKMKQAKSGGYKYRSISKDQGADFQSGMGNYKFLDFYYAIPNTEENRNMYPNSEVKLNHIIVESEIPIEGLAVVENSDTGRLGIFTGVLKTKLKDMHDVDTLISHNQYQVVEIYEHINLVQYQIDDIALAIKTHKELYANPKVLRVSLEILEYQRTQI